MLQEAGENRSVSGLVLEKERVLAAAKSCPQAEAVLKILCPEFFERPRPEWEPQVGDVVECREKNYFAIPVGAQGVILDRGFGPGVWGVFWNINIGGHGLAGRCPDGFGRWMRCDSLRLVNRPSETE